jgi:glycerol dehydrogenase
MADAGTFQSLIAPRRYIQGRGVLASIGRHVAELGRQPLLLADENVWKLTGDQLSASFKEAGVEFTRETFGGVCSHREIDRITEVARKATADVVVGIGGGTTLDTAKASGHQAGIAWATVPTVASTDAPTSALSVVYTDDGVFEEYVFFPHNPDLVLVDTQVCANAPYRFLVSGMGDALAPGSRPGPPPRPASRPWPAGSRPWPGWPWPGCPGRR